MNSDNSTSEKKKKISNEKIWVFAPYTQTTDANLDYYCDYTQSIAEYERVFASRAIPWEWVPVRLHNIDKVIASVLSESELTGLQPVVLNLCDGDEINGSPGVTVIKKLQNAGMVFTGADEKFFALTTSKIPMKHAFDVAGVPTPLWEIVNEKDDQIFDRLGAPLIIKPAVSGGSLGVGIKNVVYNFSELRQVVKSIKRGYRGWNLASDGVIAEQFIQGREFTVFISGSANNPENAHIYSPVERVFHPSLPPDQRFLSFDRLWEIYEAETAMPDEGNFYEYQLAPPELHDELKGISWAAYCATNGKGYTRVDIRLDEHSRKFYILEVNAQCGISEDENYTSIGAILKYSEKDFSGLVFEIIADGKRRKKKAPAVIKVRRNRKERA